MPHRFVLFVRLAPLVRLALLACLVIPMAMTPVAAAEAPRLPLWNGAAPVPSTTVPPRMIRS